MPISRLNVNLFYRLKHHLQRCLMPDWFRQQVHDAGGGNYQTLINEALREHMQVRDETMEHMLRKVIREELQAATQ